MIHNKMSSEKKWCTVKCPVWKMKLNEMCTVQNDTHWNVQCEKWYTNKYPLWKIILNEMSSMKMIMKCPVWKMIHFQKELLPETWCICPS